MNSNSKIKIKNFRRGFTLIEMLVVVFVVGIGLVGALSFFNININNQFEAKNELIAAGLAQEGADLVRNIRDYNLLNSSSRTWDQGLAACNGNSIDYTSLSNHACFSSQDICIDTNKRYHQCSTGNKTNFTRKIEVSSLNPDGSRKVTCTVSWNGRKTESVDYFYNNSF